MQLQLRKVKNFWFLQEEANYLNSLVTDLSLEDVSDTKNITITTYQVDCNRTPWWLAYACTYLPSAKRKVTTEGSRADLSWLIREVFQIRVALTNIAHVAKKLPTSYNAKAKMRLFLIGDCFNNLVREESLAIIAQACETMSARCMKSYRRSKAPCCKRYYSLFRAIEQQAERLEERLDRWITEE